MSERRTCDSCGAPIIWCFTNAGKRMPVNAEPIESGNLVVDGTSVRMAQLDDDPHGPRWLSHFATCPHGKGWRKR